MWSDLVHGTKQGRIWSHYCTDSKKKVQLVYKLGVGEEQPSMWTEKYDCPPLRTLIQGYGKKQPPPPPPNMSYNYKRHHNRKIYFLDRFIMCRGQDSKKQAKHEKKVILCDYTRRFLQVTKICDIYSIYYVCQWKFICDHIIKEAKVHECLSHTKQNIILDK